MSREARERDRARVLARVRRAIAMAGGDLKEAASRSGYCRARIYQLVREHDLWAEIDAARTAAGKHTAQPERRRPLTTSINDDPAGEAGGGGSET